MSVSIFIGLKCVLNLVMFVFRILVRFVFFIVMLSGRIVVSRKMIV